MMHSHTNCICLTFSTVRFKCFFKSPCREYAWPLVYNLFGFQMHPQIACLNRCKFALTAFVYSSPLCVLKLLWYFRRSMLPLQLWIHLSKSLEISHEEDRDKRESTQSVRAWRCRALMWVFISIQIDPVIIFSQDFLLQLLLWLVSGHRPLLRLQMVSKEAYYTKEKSCTTWQDMFRHRLPQNRCSIMHNFAVFWRKFAHRCDLIYENDGTLKDSCAV